jgi:FAD/FMN-containing dehydrogenase
VLNPFGILPKTPKPKKVDSGYILKNWGNNQSWTVKEVIKPKTLDELVKAIKENKHGKIKAFGSLHSWSLIASTEGLAIDMKNLNRVLEVDSNNKTVTVEVGMTLKDFNNRLLKENMAIETMPNVDEPTIGGILSNAVHGTKITIGTFIEQVEEIVLVTASGNVLTLNKNFEKDKHFFDAAIVSFGFLGVIYSAKIKTVKPYFVLKCTSYLFGVMNVIENIYELVRKSPDGIQFNIYPHADFVHVRRKVDIDLELLGENRLMDLYEHDTSELIMESLPLIRNNIFPSNVYILSWHVAELRTAKKYERFVNMEYTVKESCVKECLKFVVELHKKYNLTRRFAVRPIGRDYRGYLI